MIFFFSFFSTYPPFPFSPWSLFRHFYICHPPPAFLVATWPSFWFYFSSAVKFFLVHAKPVLNLVFSPDITVRELNSAVVVSHRVCRKAPYLLVMSGRKPVSVPPISLVISPFWKMSGFLVFWHLQSYEWSFLSFVDFFTLLTFAACQTEVVCKLFLCICILTKNY